MSRSEMPFQAQQISRWVEAHRDEIVALASKLVSAESPSLEPALNARVLEYLGTSLAELGYHVRRLRGRNTAGHLLARPTVRPRSRRYQLLIGHCDTVWPEHSLRTVPLEATEGKLHGPGIYDTKAGLAQLVFALKALSALKLRPRVRPVVFINSDEELGSPESTRHIRRLARGADRALIIEPALGPEGRLKTARKGVGRYTVRIRGQAAHAGLGSGAGASTILELSHIVQKLVAMNDATRGITVNVGMVDGGLHPNAIAAESTAVVDVRVPTQGDAELMESRIRSLTVQTPGTAIEVEGGIGRLPLERTKRNRALWESALGAAQLLGIKLEDGAAGGASDGNTTSLYAPTLDGLGAVGGGVHPSHEFIYVDRLAERTALLALLVLGPPMRGRRQRRPPTGGERAGSAGSRSSSAP
jgi:glutamate carboxypeptidase